MRTRPRVILSVALPMTVLALGGCGSEEGPPVDFRVPAGSDFSTVTDTLVARGLVGAPRLFTLYARARGDDTTVKAGRYRLPRGSSWGTVLDALTRGNVATEAITVPEGYRLSQMAPVMAEITGVPPDSVLAMLEAPAADSVYGVPGPGLEGYLFPDTYRFAPGVEVETVLRTMVDRYREAWTPEHRALLADLDLDEQEVVTLASIIQAEARRVDEMPLIASVYHNRLERGWLLQADPTVLYALGGYRERLLYAAIDSVADHPYNTYDRPGLPPGPIGAPGEVALGAALDPAETDYMYFVAWPDGSHVFTRTLAEHNRAKAEARRERERIRRESGSARDGDASGA